MRLIAQFGTSCQAFCQDTRARAGSSIARSQRIRSDQAGTEAPIAKRSIRPTLADSQETRARSAVRFLRERGARRAEELVLTSREEFTKHRKSASKSRQVNNVQRSEPRYRGSNPRLPASILTFYRNCSDSFVAIARASHELIHLGLAFG